VFFDQGSACSIELDFRYTPRSKPFQIEERTSVSIKTVGFYSWKMVFFDQGSACSIEYDYRCICGKSESLYFDVDGLPFLSVECSCGERFQRLGFCHLPIKPFDYIYLTNAGEVVGG
jgi:hypothetical protein